MFNFKKKNKKRAIDAGSLSPASILYKLKGLFSSGNVDVKENVEKSKARARELYYNSPLVKSYFNLLESNVLGKDGITLQMKAKNNAGQLDLADNSLVEDAWKDWCLNHASINGKYNFKKLQRLVLRTQKLDGEVFIRCIVNKSLNKYGFALQILESDLLDSDFNQILPNGNVVKMGIEFGEYEKPVAYHFFKKHPNENIVEASLRERIRISADHILHIQNLDRVNSVRGLTSLTQVLQTINSRNDYMKAELLAAKNSATLFATITSESPDGMDYLNTQKDGENLNNSSVNYSNLDLQPNDLLTLPPDMKFQTHQSDHPKTAFDSFVSNIDKSVASGLGVSYHALTDSFEKINYSSARTASLEKRPMYQTVQQDLIDDFIRPIFNKWVDYSLLFGAFTFYTKDQIEKLLPNSEKTRQKFKNGAKFNCRGWNWVDPKKEVEAYIMAYKAGFVSLQEVVKNYSGRDIEDVLQDRKQAESIMKQLGITISSSNINSNNSNDEDLEEEEQASNN